MRVLALVLALVMTLTRGTTPKRIVSLIPAVTEMLFAIGAGPQIAAVSSFDTFPPDVKKLPRVGALIDPDVEKILSLHPDLVVVFSTQTNLREQLARAKIPTYVYSHAGLSDVFTTMREIGARAGRERAADELARTVESRIDALRTRVAAQPKPRTLIVFDREKLALRGIYASGGVGFIHDMVAAAGGDNVFSGVKQQAVQATAELILARRPEVILELRADPLDAAARVKEIGVWNTLSSLPAVRSSRVYLIADQRTVVPGPRVAEGVELIARALHPEAFK
jgi:iron complex transport system substrate-binding protein